MVDSENERENGNESEKTDSASKESGMRGMFNRTRAATTEKLERLQEAATPHMEKARDAAAPHIEQVQEAAAPHVERATEIAAPHVERASDIYAKTVGAEFREEFRRYVNAAATTIVGLHQDQAALRDRIAQLEEQVKALQQQIEER